MAAPEAQFGKYKLLAKIAAGGMAIAYRAELSGAAGVRKRVVLKVIHPHLAQEKNFIQMFISEAKVAASLTHGNIAQVFDFGQIDGRYYLSMEEVIGQPLSKVLKVARDRGFHRFPVPLAMQIAIGVLDGLHYAHTRKDETGAALNLVHRDVTPDNVLLSYEGEVKVVDFGIAKTTFSVDQTEAGMVRGKYPYLSPEQASGQRDLDARTDLWATAVQLYDLLCGRRPYEGEFLHVMREIVGPIPVPSLRSLTPGLDPALDAIVMGALKKPRAERYATAREFSNALTNYLHQHYPSSTRQDVQFLLATLFSADAAKEGADVTVPPSFGQELTLASAGASTHRPGPPVATEPPGPAQLPAGAGLKITPSTAESSRNLLGREESTSSGIEIDLEDSLRALTDSDDEPTIHAKLPRQKSGERPGPPVKKKGESERRLKPVDTSPPRPRSVPPAPPVEARAVTEPENRVPDPDKDEIPTIAGMPEMKPQAPRSNAPKAVPDTIEVSQQVGIEKEHGQAPRRTSLMVAVATVVLSALAVAGFVLWRSITAEPESPKSALVQLWVTSSPPGANFKVDGVASGKTPASANVAPGAHQVVVELVGYAPWSRDVTARSNENLNVPATLELVGTAPGPAEAVDGGPSPAVAVAPGPAPTVPPEVKPTEKPAAEPSVAGDESHFAKWPRRTSTLRLAKMALPLDAYTPLRIELNPKTTYAMSTQGSVSLGPGRSTSTLMYFLEADGPAASHVGLLTPTPKPIRNARAIRVFVFDDDLSDNTGTMRVVARVSQYVPEKLYAFDATKHVLVPKPEHQFRIEGMSESAQYLFWSRPDQPLLNKNKDGRATELLCVSQSSKPRPLAKSVHLIQIGAHVILDDTESLSCFFPDDQIEDNSGSVELDIVDAAKAADEGVNPKLYSPTGK